MLRLRIFYRFVAKGIQCTPTEADATQTRQFFLAFTKRLYKLDDAVETLPAGVLSTAIRADLWRPQKTKEKRN